ncbi:hypothetical protein RND81_11G033500 [Saponaria officinalis]|uniref:F-box domain-containing protein n=1 Tax=Saponaria officinalis TaxID=3572 RepID=A0AAW1HHG1_SAPOF
MNPSSKLERRFHCNRCLLSASMDASDLFPMKRLPECLLIEILSLLPIKSLLRLKSVNKLCYDIIKSPYFISKHLKHNNGRHNNCIIAQFEVTRAGELQPSMVWLDDEIDEDSTIHNYTTLQKAPSAYDYCICGPCDGLYYIWCGWASEDRPWCRVGKRCLWNPALQQVKTLPSIIIMKSCMPLNIEYSYDEYCGFGFDPVTADYKVVLIKGVDLLVRNDSWRYAGDLSKSHYRLSENSSYTFVHTSYYWLGSNDEYYPLTYDIIIVVNLATEAIEEIGLPEMRIKDSIDIQWYTECLMVYHSTIALVTLYKDSGNFDIWTLKERSWSKQLSVRLLVRNKLGHRCLLGYHRIHKNMLLFRGWRNKLVIYYLDSKEWRVIPVGDIGVSVNNSALTFEKSWIKY